MASQANIKAVITADDKASATLSRFGNNVENSGKRMAGAMKAAKIATVATATAVGVALVKNFDNAIKRVDTLNNFPKVLMAMGASANDAKASTDKLSKALDGLPTPIDEAATGVQSFVAAGLDVPKATSAFLAMNDALLASGQNSQDAQIVMQSLARAVSAGSVDASTMQAALSRMPTVMQALSKETGKSSAELFKLYSNDPQKLIDAMIRLDTEGSGAMKSLQQQAKDATGGIGTSIDNMNTAIARGIAYVIESIGSEKIAGAIANVGTAFETGLKTIPVLLAKLSELGRTVGEYLLPKLQALRSTVSTQLIPALMNFWKNVIEPLVPVIGTVLVHAFGLAIDVMNVAVNVIAKVTNFLARNKDMVYAVVIAVGVFKAVLFIGKAAAAFNAAVTGMTNMLRIYRTQGLASAIGQTRIFRGLVSRPLSMPAIGVAAAIASLYLVVKAAQAVIQAIRDVNAAADASAAHTRSQEAVFGRLQNLAKNGSPAQRARARRALQGAGGFATGGFTGQGRENEVAGVVHRGEYVVPKSQVDQSTGLPRMGGNQVTLNVNVGMYAGTEIEKRKIAKELFRAAQDLANSQGMTLSGMFG